MTIPEVLAQFARDSQLHTALILIAVDVLLGVAAAVKTNTFQLARIADTLRDDVLGKLVPWLAVFTLGKVSAADVLGLDLGTAADIAWAGLTVALGASILKSLGDLGAKVPPALGGSSKPA